jgi:DNA-binding IclR family transcriptional regulator
MRGESPRERAALVAWHIAHGESLTVANVMSLTGLSYSGAHRMMTDLARVLPIYQERERPEPGRWQVVSLREEIAL